MIASISTLLVFIAKVAFIKTATKTKVQKRKAYLVIAIVTLIYSVIFILFSVLKVFGIDTSNQKTYEGIWGALFIAFILLMFILSVIKLKGAFDKNDIILIGLKEITFVSALTDLVIIEEFISRIILQYNKLPNIVNFDSYFVLGISVLVILVPILMLIRWAREKAKDK